MGRTPCCEKNGLKKGPWTSEEDEKLIDYIQKNGYGNWRTLPKNAGLQRCGKSCRLRWTNYLRPDIKRGRFSFDEEETIIQLHSVLGNKWSAIAARLPGRTDNEIKNYWNTHIRKRLLRMGIDPVTHNPRLDLLDISSILSSSFYNPSRMNLLGVQPMVNPELLKLAASLLSSHRNQNPNFIQGNTQEKQFENTLQVQENHLAQLPNHDQALVQDIPSCAPLHTPCVPYSNEENHLAQLSNHDQTLVQDIPSCAPLHIPCVPYSNDGVHIVEPNVDQISSCLYDFKPQNYRLNDWQNNDLLTYNNLDNVVDFDNYGSTQFMTEPQSNFDSKNFEFASDFVNLSTPSSSTTPLNSNSYSTQINGNSTEDEKEISYCSNLFKQEFQEMFDSSIFM